MNQKKKEKFIKKYIYIITLILFYVILGILNPKFMSTFNMKTILIKSSILAALSTGMVYVLLIGSIDLSIGGIISCSAVFCAVLLPKFGYYVYFLVMIFGLVVGLFNGILVAKGKIPSFVATLGTCSICLSIAYVVSGGKPVSISNKMNCYRDFAVDEFLGIPNIVFISLFFILIAWFILRFSVFGKYIYSVGNDEKVVLLSGVNVEFVRIKAFIVNGIFAAIGGILLFGRMASGTPTIGNNYLLPTIAAAVVGGTSLTGGSGNVGGVIVGALIITLINNGMNVIGVNPFIQGIVMGIILIIFVAINLDRRKIPVLK